MCLVFRCAKLCAVPYCRGVSSCAGGCGGRPRPKNPPFKRVVVFFARPSHGRCPGAADDKGVVDLRYAHPCLNLYRAQRVREICCCSVALRQTIDCCWPGCVHLVLCWIGCLPVPNAVPLTSWMSSSVPSFKVFIRTALQAERHPLYVEARSYGFCAERLTYGKNIQIVGPPAWHSLQSATVVPVKASLGNLKLPKASQGACKVLFASTCVCCGPCVALFRKKPELSCC